MTVSMTISVAVRMTVGMTVCMTIRLFTLQRSKVVMGFPEHPDRERELEVRVCNGDILVEDALDRLLRPRAVLSERPGVKNELRKNVNEATPTGRWRDITSRTARSMGSAYGYLAYMSAMVAQQVCTTCVSLCSTHSIDSHACPCC